MEEDISRILAMTDEQILDEVRASGHDPDQIAAEGREIFERAVAMVNGWHVALTAFRAVLLDVEGQDMTVRELRRLLLANRATGVDLIGSPVDLARYINGLERLP